MRPGLAWIGTLLAATYVLTFTGGRSTVRSELSVPGTSSDPTTIAVAPFLVYSSYTRQAPPDELEKVGSVWIYFLFGAHEIGLSSERMPKPRPVPGPLPAALRQSAPAK